MAGASGRALRALRGRLRIRIEGTFLRSKVARRVFLLFVLSAFVPAALLTVIALAHVNSMDEAYGRRQVAQEGNSYAQGLYERLLNAQFILGVQTAGLREGFPLTATDRLGAERVLRTTYRVKGDAVSVHAGRATGELLDPRMQPPLGGTEQGALRVQTGAQAPRILLAAAIDPQRPERGMLVAQVEPAYLWGDKEDLSPQTQLCVIDGAGNLLFCSDEQAWQTLRAAAATGADDGAVADGLRDQRGLFLRARFAADDWTIVTRRAGTAGLAASAKLTYVFLGVVVLTLLLVAFLSMTQIRRTLVPLERLIEGTRRIAREEFDHPVKVERDDEFGQLAQAFNGMASRLGQQIGTLRALSEIDQEILSRVDIAQIIARVQERLHEMWPGATTSVVVFDPQAADFGIVHMNTGEGGMVASLPTQLDPRLLKRLARDYDGMWFDVGGSEVPDFLSVLVQAGARRILVLPIFWRKKVNGLLTIGLPEERVLSEEQVHQARDLSNRIGVALASHARDEQLKHRAYHDSLTGLPNRALLFERLQQEIAHARRQEKKLALLFIDLDRFKHVNDSFGHGTGDKLLNQVAARLVSCVREGDTVARLSGDEFVVLLPGLDNPQQCSRLASEMLSLMAEPFMIDGNDSYLGASIGVAIFPEDGSLAAELMKKADMAMYRAKAMGRGRVVFFEEEMNAVQQERARMERALRQALARQEFTLCYQPRFALPGETLAGAEALLRWHHKELGWVPPAQFIPLAEEVGLIEQIGMWVLQQVGEQLVHWQGAGLDVGYIAINISARQLKSGRLVQQVQAMLAATGVRPGALELEVTESTLIDNFEDVSEQMNRLKQAGVQIALDDFGTGYSSMTYLQRLPLDMLKIDRSFTQDLGRDAGADSIVQSIIALGHALQKVVVAEGVETARQLALLQSWGCEQVQGEFFSRPLTAGELEALLTPSRPAELI